MARPVTPAASSRARRDGRGSRRSWPEEATKRYRARRRARIAFARVFAVRRCRDAARARRHVAWSRIAPARSRPRARRCSTRASSRAAHYVDITGEIDVFVAAQRRHNEARRGRHRRLPGRRLRRHPHRLHRPRASSRRCPTRRVSRSASERSARAAPAPRERRSKACGMARACARTARSSPSRSASVRARSTSAPGPSLAVSIPWGDVATAYFTTGIANIEVYVPASHRSIARLRRLDRLRPLLAHADRARARRRRRRTAQSRAVAKGARYGKDLGLGRSAQRPRRCAHRAPYDTTTAIASPPTAC